MAPKQIFFINQMQLTFQGNPDLLTMDEAYKEVEAMSNLETSYVLDNEDVRVLAWACKEHDIDGWYELKANKNFKTTQEK